MPACGDSETHAHLQGISCPPAVILEIYQNVVVVEGNSGGCGGYVRVDNREFDTRSIKNMNFIIRQQ
jgi:hypothetical protein